MGRWRLNGSITGGCQILKNKYAYLKPLVEDERFVGPVMHVIHFAMYPPDSDWQIANSVRLQW